MYCSTSVTQLRLHRFLEIDPALAAPIWRQIEDGMRRLVASERIAPGSVVPSVRELARALRVNPATVSKAFRRLTEAGLGPITVNRILKYRSSSSIRRIEDIAKPGKLINKAKQYLKF